jgi:DNA-binding NarL/FixJ family response regulator
MIRILIVEDYQLVRRGIKSNIEKEDDLEIVAEVDTADEAIQKALELKPDIVLMDIKLGGDENAGIRATKVIKEKLKDTKVLILTFYDDEASIIKAIDARIDGYLLKDVDQRELVRAIRNINEGKAAIHPAIAAKLMHRMAEKGEITKKKQDIEQNLSQREYDVFKLLVKGFTNKDIAEKLYISEATIKAHISAILRKLDVTDRVQAVILAINIELFKD